MNLEADMNLEANLNLEANMNLEASNLESNLDLDVASEPTATGVMVDQVIEQFIDSESVPEDSVEDSLPETDLEADKDDKMAPTYDEAFPPLAGKAGAVGGMAGAVSFSKVAGRGRPTGPLPPRVKTSTITVLFHIPGMELQPGDHTNIVKTVSAQTSTSIEISKSRDGSVTVMVTGKAANVSEAKVRLQKDLQTNATATISIPKEHHKNIIGKNRSKIEQIQKETGTQITIPPQGKNDDNIKVEGSKEGIEKAMFDLRRISDDQFARHRESVVLARKFYPWIKGGRKNNKLEELQKETGCRINVPPYQAENEEIIVTGEKEKVIACIDMLQRRCRDMEENFSHIQVEIRQTQHMYIKRGNGIQDIFDKTNVWVEIPTDGSQTIKLYGLEDSLSPALSLLFEKANSIKTCDVECPAWLLKYVIGKNGENIRSLSEKFPKTTINCQSEKNIITIDAPGEEYDAAREEITKLVDELILTRSRAVIKIDHKIHKHLIGKAGSNINKIKSDTGVNIKIPQEEGQEIEIVGPPEGVAKAREMLLEQAKRIENEASVELVIEQKWHRLLIGTKGESIQKIRVKFPEVQVSFPTASSKSPDCDKVSLRGPKKDVEAVSSMLKSQLSVIMEENFTMKVPILKNHHRYIIGKGGVNIRKVKEETNTRIDLPSEAADSDLIVITGKKADVDLARKKLLAIQAELEDIYEEEISIDPKLHNTLIGAKGRIIRSIIDESGSVQVRFPSADNPSEKVSIRGEKADVLKAKEKLLSMAHEKELESFCIEIPAKADYHRFLIGKKGSNVQKLKKEFGVNYAFPRSDEKDQDTITIMGRQEQVEKAAENLRESIKELDNTAEDEIKIDSEFFKKVTSRSTIDQMTNELGGIKIVPRPSSNTVKISGPKSCVEEFKSKMEAMIDDLKAQVEIQVEISRQHHRDIIGPQGHNVRKLTATYGVQISFPPQQDRKKNQGKNQGKNQEKKPEETPEMTPEVTPEVAPEAADNGHLQNGTAPEVAEEVAPVVEPVIETAPDPQDIIKVVGRPENCEQARLALLDLIPISLEVEIPFEFHRMLIGKSGENIKSIMDEFDVNVQVPGTTLKSNIVIVRGHKDKVEECKSKLELDCKKWDDEKEDRAKRSYSLNLTVDHRHHSKIIGRRGAVINKIKDSYKCQIRMPDRNSSGSDQDVITIVGYEADAIAARDSIMKIVSELEERVTGTVEIDSRLHARLIGQRGKNIRKIMEKFGVDIKFSGGETGNTVSVEGNEANVEECKEHLLELAEEMMDAVLEKIQDEAHQAQYSRPRQQPQPGFFVRDAPWQEGQQQQQPPPQVAPDTSDLVAFPGLGATSAPRASAGTWGGNKQWR